MNLVTCLKHYVHLVDNNNYRLTAKQIGISASTLSKQISWLEEVTQRQLILRTTRKFSVTTAGTSFYQYAQDLVNIWQQTTDTFFSNKETLRGKLRIGFPLIFSESLMPIISDFANTYPNIDIVILRVSGLEQIKQKSFNCFFWHHLESPLIPSWDYKSYSDFSFGIYVSPEYFDNHPKIENIHQLEDHNCFINTNTPNPFLWNFKSGKVRIKGNLITGLAPLLIDAAVLGSGVLYMPEYCVQKELKEGKLIHILPEENHLESQACLYYPKDKLKPYITTLFTDFMLKHLQKED